MSNTIDIIRKLGYDKNKKETEIESKQVEKKSIQERIDEIDSERDLFTDEVRHQRAKAVDKKRHLEREIVELRSIVRDFEVEIKTLTLQLEYGA